MTFKNFTMDLDEANLLLFSDQNSELFVNTVEVSTTNEQEIESTLNGNVSSPEKSTHTIVLSYTKRRTKYDQINVVKVQDHIVSTKVSSAVDSRTCPTLNVLGGSNVLHSILQPPSQETDLVKSNVQTIRTVPNILRNSIPKENTSYSNKILESSKRSEVTANYAKTSVHKRKQVYNSSSIRQESPDWLSDNHRNERTLNNLVQKQSTKVNSENCCTKYKRRFDNKKINHQKNCFLPVANDGLLKSMNDTDLFGDYIFTEDVNNNSLNDLFNFSDETVIDNTFLEYENSNYFEYSSDIVGSEKLDGLLDGTIDSYIQSDTCDFNGNDIDTSQTISCTSNQCDQSDIDDDNTGNEALLSEPKLLENFVEDTQLNNSQTSKWCDQPKIDDYVTFDINDIENECIINSGSCESPIIQEIICDKYSNTLLEFTDMKEIKEMGSYGKEHETKDMCMLSKDITDCLESTKFGDKKQRSVNGETFLHDSKDVSPRTIKFRGSSTSDKNLVRKKSTSTLNEKKVRNTAKFQCPLCPMYFRTQRTMAIHRAGAHGGMYVILCEHCGRLFNNKYHLNRHIINCRYAQRPFKCDHCDRYYRHKSSLVQHLRNVHKIAFTFNTEKQYTCDKCSKVYSKYGAFEKHISLHDHIEVI